MKKTSLPTVQEKVKTQIVKREIGIKTLLKESQGSVITFDKEETVKKIQSLVRSKTKRIKELIALPELDKKQLDEAKAIRAELRENRYDFQNIKTHNKGVLNTANKNNGLMIDEVIKLITPTEDVIDTKIKDEENKVELAKEKAKRDEEERVAGIQEKLDNASIFFEKELEIAKESNDWKKYAEYYEEFEANLSELQELEYEGEDLLKKYAQKRTDAIKHFEEKKRLAAEKEIQDARDLELKNKEEELQKATDKAKEDKRRMQEFFGIGFMFNGVEFFKDDSKYIAEEINEKTNEEFDKIIKFWKDSIEEENNQKQKQKQLIEDFKERLEEATGLNLKLEGFDLKEEEINEVYFKNLVEFIDNAKTEAGRKKAEEEEEEKKKADAELKKIGKEICDLVNPKITEIVDDFKYLQIKNVEALNAFNEFVKNIDIQYLVLKKILKQDDENIQA